MLVIPDFYDRAYVREIIDLLLVVMGFKQICAQQVCAQRWLHRLQLKSYIGSPSCNLRSRYLKCLCRRYRRCEDKYCLRGWGDGSSRNKASNFVPNHHFPFDECNRMTLNMAGDDITEFLYVLLERIKFPYREIDLNHYYDWQVMEDLKSRLCTLADVGVDPWFPLVVLSLVDRAMWP